MSNIACKSKFSPSVSLLNSKVDFAKNEAVVGDTDVIPGESRGTFHVESIAGSSIGLTVVKVSVAVFYWCPVQPIEIVGSKQIVSPNPNVTCKNLKVQKATAEKLNLALSELYYSKNKFSKKLPLTGIVLGTLGLW